ncbi:hypothetical protein DFJ43DRAFT_1150784 [Lentinula guzmanii]|uniref:Uncharacterized protein n=1 Tax=Lentinula guzmanii TaxID=2804957 RepID=A0AA38JPB3_9AGAR|nr:hypothetical protein DFJ43DRAFT_1150784 [Lentinula guzmanii]
MCSGHFLLFALISLLIQVGDADQHKDYSSLNNGQGKTPCDMTSDIESCSGSLEARDTSQGFPSPNQCTCTNIYFNIWSACLFSDGDANSTVPSSNWTDTCEQQGYQMETVQYNASNGMDLPPWTFINLTANQTFDIAEALSVAAQNSAPRNKIQVIVPIVVGIVVCAAFVGILIWRSRKKGSPGILLSMRVALSRGFRNGFGTRKIKAGSRDQEWVIDRPTEVNEESLEMLSNPSSRRSTGHVRLSSSSSAHFGFGGSDKPTGMLPGKNLWKNSHLVRKIRRTLIMLPIPWRSAPVPVQSISPSRKFEIDASSNRTRTDSTLQNYRRAGFRNSGTRTETTDSALATSRYDYYTTIHEEEEEEEDDDSDLVLGDLNFNNEQDHLIANENNHPDLDEVMLISGSGDDFTLHSDSHNSDTSRSHRIPPSPVQPRSHSPVQSIPPPPRTPVRERHAKFSRRTPPPPRYPPPIPTDLPPIHQALNKPSIESILQSSAVTTTDDATSSRQPQLSPPQRRHLPLPTPPDAHLLRNSPSQHSISSPPPLPAPSYTYRNDAPPLPPEHVDNTHPPDRPPGYTITHTRNQSASTNNSSSFPEMSSPPYRPSLLPEEVLIARSDSPPPPPSTLSSPPYNATTLPNSQPDSHYDPRGDTSSSLLLAPSTPPPPLLHYHHADNSHHRLMSLPTNIHGDYLRTPHSDSRTPEGERAGDSHSGLADQHGYPFEATLSPRMHYRNFSDESLTPSTRQARNANAGENFVDNRLLIPGAVRGAGYMSSSVNTSSRDLRVERSYESFRTVFNDSQSTDNFRM